MKAAREYRNRDLASVSLWSTTCQMTTSFLSTTWMAKLTSQKSDSTSLAVTCGMDLSRIRAKNWSEGRLGSAKADGSKLEIKHGMFPVPQIGTHPAWVPWTTGRERDERQGELEWQGGAFKLDQTSFSDRKLVQYCDVKMVRHRNTNSEVFEVSHRLTCDDSTDLLGQVLSPCTTQTPPELSVGREAGCPLDSQNSDFGTSPGRNSDGGTCQKFSAECGDGALGAKDLRDIYSGTGVWVKRVTLKEFLHQRQIVATCLWWIRWALILWLFLPQWASSERPSMGLWIRKRRYQYSVAESIMLFQRKCVPSSSLRQFDSWLRTVADACQPSVWSY